MARTILQCLLFCGLSIADAGVAGVKSAVAETSAVSPEVSKDTYPYDKRPKVDVLHFKHPYPAVQDSDDFDKDFVKDENSDDGSYRAQSEYDRLRHKLVTEKADVAKALKAKDQAENELREAMKRKADAEEHRKKLEKEAEEEKKRHEEKKKEKKKGSVSGSAGKPEAEEQKEVVVAVPESVKIPGGVAAPARVDASVTDVKRAMDALDECKKELEEARQRLKGLMKELEAAKVQQAETEASMETATERVKSLEGGQAAADKASEKEKQEYLAAKKEYEEQQAVLEKMEADIKVAAEKVKALRDAADADGGVYNTKKSGAAQHVATVAFFLAVLQIFQ